MAQRIYSRCYACDNRFKLQTMSRIDREENADKCEIAIRRREEFHRPPLDVTNQTRICLNCSRSISNEITLIEQDPSCIRLEVLTQTRSSTCLICNADVNLIRLSDNCRANVFVLRNIYIPDNIRSCRHHLNNRGYLLQPLLLGLRSVNRPYVIKGLQLHLFLQGLRAVAQDQSRIVDENSIPNEDFECFSPATKEQFQDLFTYCDRVPRENGYRYVSKKDLLMFLCKLRQGLSDEFLKVIFQYPSRQATSLAIATVRQSLMQRFVPNNIGFDAITRDNYIERHVTEFANHLYNPQPHIPQVIAIIDGTYTYIHKSSNFRALRQSYSLHKGRHLLKPALIVAPDGYILEIQGPYFSDASNNDAALLQNEFDNEAARMNEWFTENDIIIVDRGYRDIKNLLARLGITCKMPAFLEAGERQLSTEDANESRLVTKNRWVVEARNGHLKSIFKFLAQVMQIQHLPNLGDYYRIAGAIVNKYHPLIHMNEANAALAQRLLEKSREPNVVQALVEVNNLHTRNAQRWVRLSADQLLDFPVLTLEFLKNLTYGIYQLKLSPSYIQDKLQRDQLEEFQVEMLRDQNRLPEPGLMRVRVFSRFRNATKHQLWISYRPIDDGIELENRLEDDPLIQGYYCTCRSGTRTLGTCAHVTSVLWFLGYARNQAHVHFPSTRMIETIKDAGNRPQQVNPR